MNTSKAINAIGLSIFTHAFGAMCVLSAFCMPAEVVAARAATVAKPAPPPKPTEQVVTYADLAHHVGEIIIVHTKFGTTRSGMLMRHNNTSLELSMSVDGKSAELTVPANTVRSVALPITPATTDTGNPSAQKK